MDPGSLIDTLATVRRDDDRPELKRSLNCKLAAEQSQVPQNTLKLVTTSQNFLGVGLYPGVEIHSHPCEGNNGSRPSGMRIAILAIYIGLTLISLLVLDLF